jgi:hypothetical protein
MNSTEKKLLDISARPIATGLMAGIGTKLLMRSQSISLFGLNLDAAFLYGGTVYLASALNATSENFILPMIPSGTVKAVGNAAQPIFTGGATAALFAGLNMYYGESFSFNNALASFVLGAGSEVAGKYAKQNFIDPLLNMNDVHNSLLEMAPAPQLIETPIVSIGNSSDFGFGGLPNIF